ncbi:MAG: hypothetical protein IJD86_04360 [Clostridia bacterium]|nr:hypothetical protein [Clostridia bacterium]
MKEFMIKAVDNWLFRILKAVAIILIALLSTLIACVQLSDLFNNIPEFENPILSLIVILLMICACRATMNANKSRMTASIAFVILSWPIVGLVQDSILYVRNGFDILIEKENAVKQIGRLLIVIALALMPLINISIRPILRKHAER